MLVIYVIAFSSRRMVDFRHAEMALGLHSADLLKQD